MHHERRDPVGDEGQDAAEHGERDRRQTRHDRHAEHEPGRDIQRAGIGAKLTEDGRSLLTQVALENVGALTALEQHLITIAPLGEARYREIVDSYTLGASAAIRRWQ